MKKKKTYCKKIGEIKDFKDSLVLNQWEKKTTYNKKKAAYRKRQQSSKLIQTPFVVLKN